MYLTLIPQFINGYVYVKDDVGGMWAYRGGEILVSVGGRDYKYIANENGYFSVPMISKLPQSLRLGFVHKDTGGRYDVIVPFTKITTANQLDFEVKTHPPTIVLAAVGQPHLIPRMVTLTLGATPANAGELRLPPNVVPIETPEAKKVKDQVQDIIGREAKKPLDSLSEKTEFTSTNGFPYIVKIRIVDAIEKKYGFRIPDDHWQSFRSVGEVVDYTQKRIALDKVEPSKDVNWPVYQNKVQTRGAPLYVK